VICEHSGPSIRDLSTSLLHCYCPAIMSAHPLHSDTNAIKDLTTDEVGDISLWIGQQKEYHNMPNYVSNEPCRHTSPLPSVLELLPSALLPVLHLLEFPTPRIMATILGMTPHASFTFHEATHSSLECCQIPAPHDFLRKLRASACQAMLDGKVSIQHDISIFSLPLCFYA